MDPPLSNPGSPTMLRLALLGSALALSAGAVHAGGYRDVDGPRYRETLPPHVVYRDPGYRPVAPIPVALPPRSLNVPLYNVPPPRFPGF